MTRISEMTPLTSLPATGAFVPVEKAGVTANYRYDLSNLANLNGLFVNAPSLVIPTGTNVISTTGADILDHGGANYVAGTAPTARSGFTSANGQNMVLSKEQTIIPAQFYQATDPDYQNAVQGALDYLATLALVGYGYGYVAPSLVIPASHVGPYLFHDELAPQCGLNISGESGIQGGGTVCQWTTSTGHLIHLKGWDGTNRHAMGSSLKGLHLKGWYAAAGDRAARHGIRVNCDAKVEDIFGEYIPGNLIEVFGDTGALDGNANGSQLRNIYGQFCDLTVKIHGGDSNGCFSANICSGNNRLGTYWDDSFLGSTCRGGLCENGGLDTSFRSRCHVGGHIYVVKYGQETWCSTNAPTGAATSNTGWLYLMEGGTNFYTATWVTGQTWYFTAPVRIGPPDNGNTLGSALDMYIEGGQNPIILAQNAKCTTTTTGSLIWQESGALHGGSFHGNASAMQFNNAILVPGNITGQGVQHDFGRISGTALDTNFNLNTTNTLTITVNRYNAAGALLATDGTFLNATGTWYLNGTFGIHLRYNGADVANAISTGLDLPTGKVLSVNGTKVVGAQGAAVADAAALTSVDATTAAAAPTQAEFNAFVAEFNKLRTDVGAVRTTLNTGLARIRTATGHGLIA